MGVPGLMTVCLNRRQECSTVYNLVEVAQQRNGIEILVDFYSFEHHIQTAFWKALSKTSGNDYLRILGGEYSALHEYVKRLIKGLQALDIHLVMFIDGGKGASQISLDHKLATWEKRHHSGLQELQNLLDVCDGNKRMSDVAESKLRPVLLEIEIVETLKECQCEIVQCTGEADFILAKNLKERQRAFAIVSNDSDFCVFRDCQFIPCEMFDIRDDLNLYGNAGPPFPDQPIRLECGVISSERVANMLGLRDCSELIELSIISGNDFTGPLIQGKFRHNLGLSRTRLEDRAQWVRRHKSVEKNSAMARELERNRELADAIHHSRLFYNLSLPSDYEHQVGGNALTLFLQDAVRQGRIPSNILAMHYKFYWHRTMLEDLAHGAPCCEGALARLRAHIYTMLLNPSDNYVTEYGRTPYEPLRVVKVPPQQNRALPVANMIDQDKIFQNLKTFGYIMLHFENRNFKQSMNYTNRYGRKKGFIAYVLRYFLRLNHQHNLLIDEREFLAVLAAVFAIKVNVAWYQTLCIVPTRRCVTISSWFQGVYRHAFHFLGKLLSLCHEFPKPHEVFSGAVFTAFYMLSLQDRLLYNMGFPPNLAAQIQQDIHDILNEYRHMTKHIVQDIYDCSHRF